MSTVQEQQLESLEELLVEIRKDVEDATLMASKVSEKFNEVSKSIQDLSSTFSKVFKDKQKAAIADAAVYATSFAVKLIGKAVSGVKKESELYKLLPKKKELARNKREVIKNHFTILENREPRILLLLEKELEREVNLSENEISKKNTLSIAFEIYVYSIHLKNVCFFLLKEFDAWDRDEHNSKIPIPILLETLDEIVNQTILPSGINSLSKINSAQAYLFKKYHSLLGTILFTAFKEGFKIEKAKENDRKIAMVNKQSFIYINKLLLNLKKQYDKVNPKTNWIKFNFYYIEINKASKFYGEFVDIGKYIYSTYLILFLLILGPKEFFTNSLLSIFIISFFLTCIVFIFRSIKNWLTSYRFSFQSPSFFERIISIGLQFTTFGSLYYAEKRLAKKEYKFYALFNQIKQLNNLN